MFIQSNFESHKEVLAAQGCKIAAKDLEKAIAGLPLYVAHNPEEVEIYRVGITQMLLSPGLQNSSHFKSFDIIDQ